MKKVRFSYLRWSVLAVLLSFVLFASISSEVGEWYAVFIYPTTSKIISAISSLVPFSLDEWTVLLFVFLLLCLPFYVRMHRKKWWQVISNEVELGLWIYVWFYWGWGMNYYRMNFYQRAEVSPVAYDKGRFDHFLETYTDALLRAYDDCVNEGWMQSVDLFEPFADKELYRSTTSGESYADLDSVCRGVLTREQLEHEVQSVYRKVPAHYGLTQPQWFQHPKIPFFHSIYSNVGVLGYMGPFWNESHINSELSLLEYPFTYAHELSHLLGVSSEAEANLWAYTVCSQSQIALVRLSGYIGLLSYVRSNAFYLLTATEFEEWDSLLPADLKAAFYRIHAYWASRYNHTLGELQSAMYDFYLKRNRISSGQKNYAQVIGMLLALPDFRINSFTQEAADRN